MLTRLRALVLGQDRATAVPVETVFGISGVGSDIYTEETAVLDAISQIHFDGIFIDYDHAAAAKIVRQIRNGRSNKASPVFVLTSSMHTIVESGTERPHLVCINP
jgi:hypothetical protein